MPECIRGTLSSLFLTPQHHQQQISAEVALIEEMSEDTTFPAYELAASVRESSCLALVKHRSSTLATV